VNSSDLSKNIKEAERNALGGRLRADMMAPMAEPNDSYPTRPSLLNRLKDLQDDRSWQEFNRIYAKLIYGFAIKAGCSEDEAAEVVQETLISAAKHLPEFRYDPKVCSFKTWLLNLSNWRVQDQMRKRQAPSAPKPGLHPARDSADTDTRTATIERVPDAAGDQLEALWEQEWKTTLFEAALARVKPQVDLKQWQIFDLYALKEWSVKDVAHALGVSVGRVYLVKHRTSALLKKELKRLERASKTS
jgi:RNA polymerase sigma-70 factor (ECF subfamily)